VISPGPLSNKRMKKGSKLARAGALSQILLRRS
jgi:hypothetical protein